MASNYRISWDLDTENGVASATVREKDEEGNFQDVDKVDFNAREINETLNSHVYLYGLSKFLQDRCSSTDTGPEKLEAMKEEFQQLRDGQWKKERSGGGGGGGVAGVKPEVEALARIKGVSIPEIQKSLKNYSKEQKEQIFGNEKVQEAAAQIREERKGYSDVDLDDMV